MAEPIPTPSSELDAPCVHVLGTDRWGGEAVSVRELAQGLVAAASANAADATSSTAHACQGWTVYVPPSTAADATPLDKLCDVEELGEMDTDDMEELCATILDSLTAAAAAKRVTELGGFGGTTAGKHAKTLTSWCTLTPTEVEWTRALQVASTGADEPEALRNFAAALTVFELAQYAIIAKGDVAIGLSRIQKICDLRQQFSVGTHTPETVAAWLGNNGWDKCGVDCGNDARGRPCAAFDMKGLSYDTLQMSLPKGQAGESRDMQVHPSTCPSQPY